MICVVVGGVVAVLLVWFACLCVCVCAHALRWGLWCVVCEWCGVCVSVSAVFRLLRVCQICVCACVVFRVGRVTFV